ncbi:MAG: hypothetical protein HUU46_19055 [Candidatus Hydrogenedentes bacterium]|nr:hypothetical protein [Candidatus Hydrogenedentota bacterium]
MHRVPMGRKFGGPEIALIAVALAFAVPMTAWWHGLYQQPDVARTQARSTAVSVPAFSFPPELSARTFVATGYIVNAGSTTGEIALPSFIPDAYPQHFAPDPSTDPNQTLLLVIALLGTVAAGVYSVGVYPALRR